MQQEEKKMKVKKGFLAVQVMGLEDEEEEEEEEGGSPSSSRRFVIPISYLYHPLFKRLLDKAYDVYGYHTDGPLKLPCSVDDFLHLRWRIHKESSPHPHHHTHPLALHFHSC
ncbi:auxin-induced protein 6B [Cajanus cajan]|uniref:Auxin-induced protein 6B n=1 Tax=Cajanus cajan TaxID=3821 RepID=A0A151T4F6_CAJCA|nr:auxin-induced protein 6B [Cajanus cajan]KYP61891.1 Auxin-induced protein 6B [Cajanus cajan]